MTHGLVLGKFLPPHAGHRYLVDFARHWVDTLTVVVGTLPTEPIPGALRVAWMRQLFPTVQVVHLDTVLPQDPSETPDFWMLWDAALRGVLSQKPTHVFASEAYGQPLAALFGARFIPVDPARQIFPISGTAVRAEPRLNVHRLPRAVQEHYGVMGSQNPNQSPFRVVVIGPESTGKTTLCQSLAQHFKTQWVPEYVRTWLAHRHPLGAPLCSADMVPIGRGQTASIEALALQTPAVLISDTDVHATVIWSAVLFGECDSELVQLANTQKADLYLLTSPDVPWVPDAVRYLPEGGADFYRRCHAALQRLGQPWVAIEGEWPIRLVKAVAAITVEMAVRQVECSKIDEG